jgi:DNA-binding beta-propeller fold protein YncE
MLRTLSVIVVAMLVSSGLGASSRRGLLLVANKGDQTLALIDPDADRTMASISEGGITGHEVAASPDGKWAFVPIYGNSGVGKPGTDGSTLAVIDLSERRVAHTIDFGRGVRPHCPIFGPRNGLLYVTTELDQSVTIIDPKTFAIVGRVPTGQSESHMLAISPDGGTGYTANVGPGTVSVLDLSARTTIGIIPVASHIQRISVSPGGREVFTSDTDQARLAVIDTETRKVKHWITLPGPGYGSAPTADGKWLLIAIPNANKVAAIDLHTLAVARIINVPSSPQEVLIRPDGQVAYVSCSQQRQVAAIDLSNWNVRLINAGPEADGLAWANTSPAAQRSSK